MTKAVRIENADTNPSKRLVVEIWDKDYENDKMILVNTFTLDHPTALMTQYLHDSNFIKIYEANKD